MIFYGAGSGGYGDILASHPCTVNSLFSKGDVSRNEACSNKPTCYLGFLTL